jgi:O-antigen ligase
MTVRAGSRRRLTAAALLLTLAMALSLLFQGPIYLGLTTAALLGALVCMGPFAISKELESNVRAFAVAFAMLGYLIVAYRLSIRPESSFSASWVLAAAPLAFIGGSAVVCNATAWRVLAISISSLMIALAAISCARFVLLAERAHQPLADPNNYAALMYLVWIPLAHQYLALGWRGVQMAAVRHALVLASSFMLVLAIIATRSRVGMIIVGVALALWMSIALFRRVGWRRVFAQAGVVALAVVVAVAITTQSDATGKGLEFGGGLIVRYELVRSALAMFGQHPLGIGVFCFPLLYPSYRSILEQDSAGVFVHNDYVQYLVEGGAPLLVLLLLFVGAVLGRARMLVRMSPRDAPFLDVGFAMALLAVCAHALVNFTFYCLPLSVLVGLLGARLFSEPVATATLALSAPIQRVSRFVSIGIAMGWIMWLYLAVDVATAGVFQNATSLGLVSSITGDERRMLEYSRIAQRINGNRGVPVIGEAILLHRAVRSEPDSDYLREQAYLTFHRALAADPWNALSYLRFSQFLDEFPPAGGRLPGESTEELLLFAIGLDPFFVPGIDRLLQYYSATSQESKGYRLLRKVVYPWMERLRRSDPNASDRYFDRLDAYAAAAGDSAFVAELKERRASLASIEAKRERPWFS